MLGGESAKKIVMVESDNFQIMQEFILKENLQIKHGGTSPVLIPGENNLFSPVVPSDLYKKPDEILNIVTPDEYKNMCLNSKPFKPYAICVNLILNNGKRKKRRRNEIIKEKFRNK